jgi:hypothetical protein
VPAGHISLPLVPMTLFLAHRHFELAGARQRPATGQGHDSAPHLAGVFDYIAGQGLRAAATAWKLVTGGETASNPRPLAGTIEGSKNPAERGAGAGGAARRLPVSAATHVPAIAEIPRRKLSLRLHNHYRCDAYRP